MDDFTSTKTYRIYIPLAYSSEVALQLRLCDE